jgi:hypothetical protein
VRRRHVAVAAHRLNVFKREPPGEHAQPRQQRLLGRRQQAVTPLDRRAQRLVAGQRSPAAPGEEAEPVAEAIVNLLGAQGPRPDRGQFDRQGQPVKPTAQAGNRRLVGGGQLEAARCRRRPLDEEHDGLVLAQAVERLPGVRRGQFERRDAQHVFPGNVERLPAGRKYANPRRRLHQLAHQRGRAPEQVLAVVEDQQQVRRSR